MRKQYSWISRLHPYRIEHFSWNLSHTKNRSLVLVMEDQRTGAEGQGSRLEHTFFKHFGHFSKSPCHRERKDLHGRSFEDFVLILEAWAADSYYTLFFPSSLPQIRFVPKQLPPTRSKSQTLPQVLKFTRTLTSREIWTGTECYQRSFMLNINSFLFY